MTDGAEAWETVYTTLYRSLGGWVQDCRIAQAADDLLVALGHDPHSLDKSGIPTGPDAPLHLAIKKLLEFRPERGYNAEFAAYVAQTDWADDPDPARQAEALNDRPAWAAEKNGKPVVEVVTTERTGRKFYRRLVPDPGPVPYLSEPVYYPVLDKEDGRTLRSLLGDVARLAGLEEEA